MSPGHFLTNIRIFHETKMLEKLKHLVTVKPGDRMTPTRTLPRVHQTKIIRMMHKDIK